ncbi:hypothetical protein PTTG_00204 [Puccinia triticina 1-1 BBBD Race 1]|uniref:Phosphatidate cytidylyltransferase n=2 Tax=Puccinia triticina TaxID=208348 RepID=A0A180H066_PUCT1|nr:uncharacterized protein PtA15_10A511 [Puccinia triticina]OAV97999.1 hypothetical protein PTTG_00204 [Puccinia triticina 1-1 BBBD Race 1]WAQ89088.1 hypothetical protein PtA15_10A511 [Puccinia triticina]WAR59147.1 hypothetical protein PtB15_10B489 [Puccinia triticina]
MEPEQEDLLSSPSPRKRKLLRDSPHEQPGDPTPATKRTGPRQATTTTQRLSIDKRRKVDKIAPIRADLGKRNLEPGWTRLRKWCIRWEVPRKVLHTSIGFITLHQWIKGTTSAPKISLGLSKALVVIVSADLLRFRSARFARFYESVLGFLMRPSEKNNWNGVIFYLIGVITTLSTLPLDISVLSILILSWVDTAASLIGRRYGTEQRRLPSPPFARRKSLAGFLGALTVGTTTAYSFWSMWAGLGGMGADIGSSWSPAALLPPPPSSTLRRQRDSFASIYPFLNTLLQRIQLPNPHSTLPIAPLSLACGLVAALAESFDFFGWDDNLVLPVLSGWGIWGLMKIT